MFLSASGNRDGVEGWKGWERLIDEGGKYEWTHTWRDFHVKYVI